MINISANAGVPVTCDSSNAAEAAFAYAVARDVLVVNSSGNHADLASARFPSNCPRVLPVGAIELKSTGPIFNPPAMHPHQPSNWQRWTSDPVLPGTAGTVESNAASTSTPLKYGVMAPGRHIYSTFGTNNDAYIPNFCGSAVGHDLSITGDAWGICSGTSMAAPHITSLAGILRSARPLATYTTIANAIRNAGHLSASPTIELGHGVPNAGNALNALIPSGTPQNRLTPLFAFYSSIRQDFFYTTAPQMAIAAQQGSLQPRSSIGMAAYSSYGTGVAVYPQLPSRPWFSPPLAEAWIFSTPENPKNAAIPLVPLFRLSFACNHSQYSNASSPTACAANPQHTDTTYTTEWAGVTEFESWGYRLDGVEGYIYPKTMVQPVGTVRLLRKYNPARDDHAIFPETQLTQMANQGYTVNSGSDWLGYVYPNTNGTTPTIQ